MIRLLILGLLVVFALVAWLLTSSSDIQITTSVKSASKTVSQERSPVAAPVQTSSRKSPAADLRSIDTQSFSNPSAKQSLNFPNGIKSSTTLNSTSTLPSTAASAGSISLTGGSGSRSGSTATSYDPSSAPSGVGFGGGPIREITIPVPVGAMVPALFQDDAPKPAQQLKALDRIASEFEQNVSEIPAGMTQEEVWDAARLIADERYMTLFGYQAYNQYHIKAAKEALKEKRARSQATEP
jgi:hypothetical protein